MKLKEHDTNNSIFHDTKKIKFKTANLMPFTRYSIEVAACNSEGDGPFCPQVPFTTPQSGILNKWKSIYRCHGLYLTVFEVLLVSSIK